MSDKPSTSSEFAQLYAGSQGRLFAFICSLVGNQDAANEILQETNLVMWEKRDEFEIGTNFTAWSFRIARYQVMAMRRKSSRDRLTFSQKALDAMAEEVAAFSDKHEERMDAMANCLDLLPKAQSELIRRRYRNNESPSEIAAQVKRSANVINVQLHRIRAALLDCIERRLNRAEGGGA